MSASMYNQPYVYKEPLPKIKYPPLFSGCRISFKHVLDSKLLALAALLFVVAFVVSLIVIISPFWFKLVLSPTEGTFGDEAEKRELSINAGIFYLNENEMDNLVELNKLSNQDVVPGQLAFAQVLEVTGVCGLVACLAASVILAMRRFASVPASFFLAFFATLSGIALLGAVFFSLLMVLASSCDPYGGDCDYTENLKWRSFPIYSQFYRVEQVVHPYIKINWAFFIAIIAAALTIAGAVLLWLDAFKNNKNLSQIRYNQLRSTRDPYEGDINPADHHKYVYKPPVQAGPMSYGMQPVAFQGGPYGAPQQPYGAAPQQQYGVGFGEPTAPFQPQQQERGGSVGFADDSFDRKPRFADDSFDRKPRQSSPPAGRRRSPPPGRRRSSSPDSGDDSPPPTRFGRVGMGRGGSPPPSHRRRSPSPPSAGGRRRSPPPRRGGPPSMNSSMSEGPFVSKEIDL